MVGRKKVLFLERCRRRFWNGGKVNRKTRKLLAEKKGKFIGIRGAGETEEGTQKIEKDKKNNLFKSNKKKLLKARNQFFKISELFIE